MSFIQLVFSLIHLEVKHFSTSRNCIITSPLAHLCLPCPSRLSFTNSPSNLEPSGHSCTPYPCRLLSTKYPVYFTPVDHSNVPYPLISESCISPIKHPPFLKLTECTKISLSSPSISTALRGRTEAAVSLLFTGFKLPWCVLNKINTLETVIVESNFLRCEFIRAPTQAPTEPLAQS